MAVFSSPKWVFFASRPTPLLKREFRKSWYLHLDKISDLKISSLLIIGWKGLGLMYVNANEDRQNCLKIKKHYRKRSIERYFKNFRKEIKEFLFDENEVLKTVIKSYQLLGPSLIYSHYLERLLTQKIQEKNLSHHERWCLKKLIQINNKYRNYILNIQDKHYELAHKHLKKLYNKHRDIDFYLLDELSNNKKLSKKAVLQRKFFYVEVTNKNITKLLVGKEAKQYLKKEEFQEIQISDITALKGYPVYNGIVKGKVLLVNKIADFKNSYKGRIIVSPMTIPQQTPYLKRQKAIVTDEGGISCHAAITAREFCIPCIVGTKIATQVLKDGDLVEVDANKGIVKVLKKR